jgi:hypothetical protein
MCRYRWGWVEESGTVRMQLQEIPLAIWHHPCALGLIPLANITHWPFKAICGEPLVGNVDGFRRQKGDSGGGVVRYNPEKKGYALVGILSRCILNYTTNLVSPIDVYVDFRKLLKDPEE